MKKAIIIAALILQHTINAAQPDDAHDSLRNICDAHLAHSYLYRHQRTQCSVHPSKNARNAFAANACYELTLCSSAPSCLLEDALTYCSTEAIFQAYAAVFSYRRGQLSSEKELLLQKQAQAVRQRGAPILPEQNYLSEAWIHQWACAEDTMRIYQQSFECGEKPFPIMTGNASIGITAPEFGHFNPKKFLNNLPQNLHAPPPAAQPSLAFVHFEEEHARRTAYAWLPALCHPQTRDLLESTLESYTDPDKRILKCLSEKAQKLCSQHQKSPDLCDNVIEFISDFLGWPQKDVTPKLAQIVTETILQIPEEQIFEVAQIITNQAPKLMNTSTPPVIPHPTATSIATQFLSHTFPSANSAKAQDALEDVTSRCLKSILSAHNLTPMSSYMLPFSTLLLKQTRISLCRKHLKDLWEFAKPLKDLPLQDLESAAQKMLKGLWIPERHTAFINGIWAIFDEHQVNVSTHQWNGAVRILQQLPVFAEFSESFPEAASVLFAYRDRPHVQDPAIISKNDFYTTFAQGYHSRRDGSQDPIMSIIL